MAKKTKKKVCGFPCGTNGKEGYYVRGAVDTKSREKDDAWEKEGQEEIFAALVRTFPQRAVTS
ncbi:hypothetical protein ACFIOY_29185 [Bradyrhizobium sp. TZ2]